MPLPSAAKPVAKCSRLAVACANRLFESAHDRECFLEALTIPPAYAATVLWCREPTSSLPFEPLPPLPWQPPWVSRFAPGSRTGQHPLHEAGAYYCLDSSSVFAAVPLLTLPQEPSLVIDVCAAPGGKSLFAWRSLHPHYLLCNETIGKRVGMLIGNLKRCRVHPVGVTSWDTEVLAAEFQGTADVVIVDAPCSGQSLLAKGQKADGCFHPVTIRHNQRRQKRILAAATTLVRPGGWLLYSTCTFSQDENEGVATWLMATFPHLIPQKVPVLAPYQSHLAAFPCYRLWPQQGEGAGAFTVLWQHQGLGESRPIPDLGNRWRWRSTSQPR
ncbi:MAG: RsmB/NOP family class I SAM-dependent RNA methyltransferase [Thermosynechococcus sp. Uc]|uniref:RsmB/NOP family class I SAM-dependent RNA methyltransferase n=1 Tax=Thermosynechococcus sp. Uc TaxID=3034853 RepID=UPI00259F0BA4|nr:RsmB/NOP family class I SAM-dependent RNA methyltransferase [Thermosynechococcus sp. Uc]MDM7326224.1 RsmB/NOP family class I SAM-dependent RNA methyltransferase [Thermosynechococcus sp. Uc]